MLPGCFECGEELIAEEDMKLKMHYKCYTGGKIIPYYLDEFPNYATIEYGCERECNHINYIKTCFGCKNNTKE